MSVAIDRDGCIGCGLCADMCPEVFSMAGDGFAEVRGEVTAQNGKLAKEAADSCPTSVIAVLPRT